jgi:biopolymer transport protein TolR
MALFVPPRAGGAAGRFTRTPSRPIAEINVTPLVDVMLVLLVIFMITAPLLATGVDVDLPKTQATALKDQDEPLAVSVDREGRIFIRDTEVQLAEVGAKLKAISSNNPDIRIFVRGDQAIQYGQVMAVLGAVHAGGFRKVALLTELPDRNAAARVRTVGAQASR